MKSYEYEGIYVFGGKDSKGKPTNSLKVISIGHNPLKVMEIQTVGTPPRERFGHCCHFLKFVDFLVIYGGRNDQMFKVTGKFCFIIPTRFSSFG